MWTKQRSFIGASVLIHVTIVCTYFLVYCVRGSNALSSSIVDSINRRDFLSVSSAAAGFGIASEAIAAEEKDGSSILPIAIVGASGRTGALCVASCLRRGIPVRALTRSGSWSPPPTVNEDENELSKTSSLLSVRECDVKDASALMEGVAGCSAVIYAASASKKGGKAKEIDNEGVVTTAKACLANNVGRYVVISSTATTRPKSLGYLFTNVYQNIMGEKRLGELGVISAYNDNKNKACSYTIIRPGGLEEPKLNAVLGPASLELSQGDVLAGIISRADLAELSVLATQAPNTPNTSFECYYTDSVQPCEKRFQSYLSENANNLGNTVSRLHGDTYDALFRELKPDGQYFIPL